MKKVIQYIFFFLSVSILALGIQNCASDAQDLGVTDSSDTGIGGSYARFMIVGDFMYIVGTNSIQTLSLSNPTEPEVLDEQFITEGVESIFNLGTKLFVGSNNGFFIYDIEENGIPEKLSEFLYEQIQIFNTCDPIVVNDSLAYVTLNTTTVVGRCRRIIQAQVNVLNIFSIRELDNPTLLAQYEMHNPKGVGLDGTTLFVCENDLGLKVFDVSNPVDIQLIAHFDDFTAFDVIPLGGLLLVVGPENVYQFDYSDLNNIHKISEIRIGA